MTKRKLAGIVIYEMGSNSLKRHAILESDVGEATVWTEKRKWDVSHRFYAQGTPTKSIADEVVVSLLAMGADMDARVPGQNALILATGVFRDIPERRVLTDRVVEATGLGIKIMTGVDEARLMASAARRSRLPQPAMICDLGGATLEYAILEDGVNRPCGSLDLGAIRNEHLFGHLKRDPANYLVESVKHCDALLSKVPRASKLYATGGTAKAIAKIIGMRSVPVEQLKALIERMLLTGPPAGLKPARARVFLPGAIILWRMAVACGADTIEQQGVAIRDGMLRRYARAVRTMAAQDLRASQILNPTVDARR